VWQRPHVSAGSPTSGNGAHDRAGAAQLAAIGARGAGEPGRGARPANCRPPRVGPPETLESRRGRASGGSGAAAATGYLRFRTAARGGGRRRERDEDAERARRGVRGGFRNGGICRGGAAASDAGKEKGEGNGDEEEEASTNRGSARIRALRVAAGGPGEWRLWCCAGINDWVQK